MHSKCAYSSVGIQRAKLSPQYFIIDPKGKIAQVFMKVKPAANSEEVLAALADLQKK